MGWLKHRQKRNPGYRQLSHLGKSRTKQLIWRPTLDVERLPSHVGFITKVGQIGHLPTNVSIIFLGLATAGDILLESKMCKI